MSFEEKITVQIEDTDRAAASFFACKFADKEIKNRAFVNALCANLVMKHLVTLGADVRNLHNLHYVRKVLEEFDIADIELPNIHIDVRGVFDENEIFIPKTHFEFDILPDIYLIAKFNEENSVDLLGFIEPKMIDKANANEDYYFVDKNKLSSILDLKYYIENCSSDTQQQLSDGEEEYARNLMFDMLDNNLSGEDLKVLLQALTKSDKLRDNFIEIENFETISYSAVNADDIVRPEIKPVEIVESSEVPSVDFDLNTIDIVEDFQNDENIENQEETVISEELVSLDEPQDVEFVQDMSEEIEVSDTSEEIIPQDELEIFADAESNQPNDIEDEVSEIDNELEIVEEIQAEEIVEPLEEIEEIEEFTESQDVKESENEEDESVIEGLNSIVLGEIDTSEPIVQEENIDFDSLPDLDEALSDIESITENTSEGSQRAEDNTSEALSRLENEEITDDAEKFVDDLDMLFHDDVEPDDDVQSEPEPQIFDANSLETSDTNEEIQTVEQDDLDLDFNVDDIDIDSLAASLESSGNQDVETEKISIEDVETDFVQESNNDSEIIVDKVDLNEIEDSDFEVTQEETFENNEEKFDINDIAPTDEISQVDEIEDVEKISIDNTAEFEIQSEVSEDESIETDFLSFDDLDNIEEVQKESTGFGKNLLNSLQAEEDMIVAESEQAAEEISDEVSFDVQDIDSLINMQSQEQEVDVVEVPEELEVVAENFEETVESVTFEELPENDSPEVEEQSEEIINLTVQEDFEGNSELLTEIPEEEQQLQTEEVSEVFDDETEIQTEEILAESEFLQNELPNLSEPEEVVEESEQEIREIEEDLSDDIMFGISQDELKEVSEPIEENVSLTDEPIAGEAVEVAAVVEETFNNQDIAQMEEVMQDVFNPEDIAAMEESVNDETLAQYDDESVYSQEMSTSIDDSKEMEEITQTLWDIAQAEEIQQEEVQDEEVLQEENTQELAIPEENTLENFNPEDFEAENIPQEENAQDLEMLFDENLTDEKIPEKYEETQTSQIPGMALNSNKSNNKNMIIITASLLAVCIVGGFAFTTKTNIANKKLQSTNSSIEQTVPSEFAEDVNAPQFDEVDHFSNVPDALEQQQAKPVESKPVTPTKPMKTQLEDITPEVTQSMSNQVASAESESYLTVKSISWQVPDYLSYSDSMKNYLKSAGKSIKLQLSSDLLLTNEYAYSKKVKIALKLTNKGAIQSATVVTSSGSKQIDNIVLQSVKSTLSVIKPPSSVIKTPEFNLTISINL